MPASSRGTHVPSSPSVPHLRDLADDGPRVDPAVDLAQGVPDEDPVPVDLLHPSPAVTNRSEAGELADVRWDSVDVTGRYGSLTLYP